ncbi:glucoamylase family protein, partial [Rubrivirga sp.]|uniref:glucoamylase family protein n=1 Tax=Rubrivirga sp. TaxID=1885344 RepID=UPI003C779823
MLRSLLFSALLAGSAVAQTATPIFDEADGSSYAASRGAAVGDASLVLEDGRLPVESGDAASGSDYGVLTYEWGIGSWSVLVGAPGFGPLDLGAADSLVVFLNGPVGVPGVSLPRLALEDADGDRTVGLSLDFRTRVGFNRNGSGFLPGSASDARLSVSYLGSLPADLVRPGYPESLRITFADTAVTISRASIGVPSVPANFSAATEGGLDLEFQFRDTDGDGTLSVAGETVTVLTPDPATGRLRPTWTLEVTGTPTSRPADGDVYRLAVFNSGIDDDPATWQRRAIAIDDFGPLGDVDASRIAGVVVFEGDAPTSARTVWVDALSALAYDDDPEGPAAPTSIVTEVGDETVKLSWTPATGANGVVVYRQSAPGEAFERITDSIVRQSTYFDLDAPNGQTVRYVLRSAVFMGLGDPLLGPDSAPIEAAAGGKNDPYIDATARLAFDYFWTEANPANGLVKDRSTPGSASSIAAVGFGLSAITVGIDRGWITREQGVERTLATLEFFATCPQSDASSGTCGYRGFFYHFLNMQTGERAGTNELSTIDTALLLGGILHTSTYYDGAGDEARIRDLADAIWRRVEWDWATPRGPLVSLGWKPESGFIPFDYGGYNEAMILYLLGLGSPTHALEDATWDAWTSTYRWQTHYGLSFVVFPPLFGHQYSHVWFDFRNTQDDYMRDRGITYFENSRRATLAQRAYSIDNPGNFPNYSADEWGLTASDDPFGYRAHGAPPAQSDNGTITPTAAGGSYAFTPGISRDALRTFYARYRGGLWGPYGLKDAYNVRENWFASDYLGIDQGPIVLMIENQRTGAIWEAFITHPDVRRGMERAGFDLSPVADEESASSRTTLAPPSPNPSAGSVRV